MLALAREVGDLSQLVGVGVEQFSSGGDRSLINSFRKNSVSCKNIKSPCHIYLFYQLIYNGARMLKKLRTSKGDYWIKQCSSSIASLFKVGTSLKGKNLLPESRWAVRLSRFVSGAYLLYSLR